MTPTVQDLISRMTLAEKVGQMTQVTLQVVAASHTPASRSLRIDAEKLETALVDYHVGSIFNIYETALTADQWREIITQIQEAAGQKTRLGIPVLYGIDAVHGANNTLGATLFPHSSGMAATWNLDLVRQEAAITAGELRACGIPWNFSPVLDVGRNPLWPRFYETYGEDPYLAATLGTAYIQGLQGDDPGAGDKVAACAKHYVGYSYPLSGKDRTPAWIPERMLRELFLPPFQAAVEAGVLTIMVNSAEINGIPVHSSHYLLTELLRDELGFKGLVVSDWKDIQRLYTRDRVAESPKDAVRMAVLAGVDMSMVPMDFSFSELLLELIEDGAVPESRIDEAVGRILTVKSKLGLFEHSCPQSEPAICLADEASEAVNLQAARESLTLLKNDGGLLPLPTDSRVLITGPAADSLGILCGGWTYTWQGHEELLYPSDKPTIRRAIEGVLGRQQVTYLPGTTMDAEIDIPAVAAAARDVDAVIVCLGEAPYAETQGNIDDLTLSEVQLRLAAALEEAGVPPILILVEGRPRTFHRAAEGAGAILMAYLPGLEGGRAIADVLFGRFNPGGKLPFTYPRYPNDLIAYDHKPGEITPTNRYEPQFPFGHGLSYTTFDYRDLRLDRTILHRGEIMNTAVTVTNTGDRPGHEVVLLYVSDLVRSITPPVRQLKRFTKIFLEAGQSQTLTWSLTDQDLTFIGRDNRRISEPGEFEVRTGPLSAAFRLT